MVIKNFVPYIIKAYYSKVILNVAEKNDAAKAIARFLSKAQAITKESRSKYNKLYTFKYSLNGEMNDMIMTSVSGHLMDLQFPSKLRHWKTVDPALLFDSSVNKECLENMVSIKTSLEELIKTCGMLVIWTDCDREGENIGMEIVNVCLAVNPNVVVKRARFSEITSQSVTRAINNLVDMDMKLSQAVDVRQELDLKLGAAFTRLQTLFLQKRFPRLLSHQVISYGSCQFPTLGFVVERFKEVENFVAEPYWKIVLTHKKNLKTMKFKWNRGRLFDENLVSTILDNITDGGSLACVIDVVNKPKSKWRPFAMDTIEMEKLSSRKLRINPKATMQIAEKLYNQGFISYPRTETNIFPKEMNLSGLVEAQVPDSRWGAFASKLLSDGIEPHNGKKTDQAHPPIYPLKSDSGLVGAEARIFELITRHFLACLSKNATAHETQILIDCVSKSRGSKYLSDMANGFRFGEDFRESFSLSGQNILEKNYLEVYPYDTWSNKEIEVYEKGEIFSPTSVVIEQEQTTPPSLLTDADLITLMDKYGIGTDSTHAEHIEKVKIREYVNNTGDNRGFLTPSKLGLGLVHGYDTIGIYLFHPDRRSKFEADLKLICQGIKQPNEVLEVHLKEYKALFLETVNQINKFVAGVAKHMGNAFLTPNSENPPLPEPSDIENDETFDDDSLKDSTEFPASIRNDEGKLPYACSQSKCEMFMGIDEVSSIAVNGSKAGPLASTVCDSDGESKSVITCKCGQRAALFTVKKNNKNKGRLFYCCSQKQKCDFFQWSDETGDDSPETLVSSNDNGHRQPSKSKKSSSAKDVEKTTDKSKSVRLYSLCKRPGHTSNKCPNVP